MPKCPFCGDEPMTTITSEQHDGSAYDMQGNKLVATPTDTIVTVSCKWCEAVVDRWLESVKAENDSEGE